MELSINFRFAELSDRSAIMSFIKSYWLSDHILANDTTFFDYRYRQQNTLQFILAKDNNEKIKGVLGFIEHSPGNSSQDIFLALWKVVPNLPDPFIGVKMIKYLMDNLDHSYINCVGITEKVIPLYKYLGFNTGKMNHFAAFNPDLSQYVISVPPIFKKQININPKISFLLAKYKDGLLTELADSDFYKENYLSYKPVEYLFHRYLDHPNYSYQLYKVTEKSCLIGVVIIREVVHNQAKALRIIDMITKTEKFSIILNETIKIILNSHYEYIDIYGSFLDNKLFGSSHFERIANNGEVIVPDHFDPFKQKNTDIFFATTRNDKHLLFKGDGDQDQPRLKN